MASTINADNGVVSGSSGVKTTADTSGVLALQSNGSTGVTLNTDLSVTFAGAQTLSAGTANGVTYLNGSKVLTSGSALTFDGQYVSIGAGASSPNGIKFLANGGGLAANLTVNHSTGEIQNFAATNYFQTWYANNSEQMRLTSTGLGIGTSPPTYKLDVSVTGNNGIRTTSSAGQQLYLGNTGGDAVVGTLNNYSLGFITNGSTRFQIGTAGQLGIGGANYGTSGQVLTSGGSGAAPTWTTPSAGALTLLSTVTASSSATVNIETGIGSTYDFYLLTVSNITTDGNGLLCCRMKIGGSYVTTYDYVSMSNGGYSNGSGNVAYNQNGTDSLFVGLSGISSTAGSTMSGEFWFSNPTSTSARKTANWVFAGVDAAYPRSWTIQGTGAYISSSAALSGIQFFFNVGNIVTGTFRLYGLTKT